MGFGEAVGEVFEGVPGVLMGVGAVILAPAVFSGARPLAKSLIKGGLFVANKTRSMAAEVSEQFTDVYSEAKMEMGDHGLNREQQQKRA